MRYYKYLFTISGGDGDAWEHTEIRTVRLTQEWITRQWLEDTLADLKRNWPQMDGTRLDVNVDISDIADGERNKLGWVAACILPSGEVDICASKIQEF